MSALRHGNGFPYDLFINYLNGKEEIGPNWAWALRLYLHTNINVCLKRLIASFNHQIVFWLLTKCEAYSELLLEDSALDKHHTPLLKLQLHDCDLLRWRRVRSFSVAVNNAHWCSNLRLRGVAVMCKVKKTLKKCYKREPRLSGRGTVLSKPAAQRERPRWSWQRKWMLGASDTSEKWNEEEEQT